MEELKNNDNLVKEEQKELAPENKEAEIQEFTQVLMQLNEEYTQEKGENHQQEDIVTEENGEKEQIQGEQQSFLLNCEDDNKDENPVAVEDLLLPENSSKGLDAGNQNEEEKAENEDLKLPLLPAESEEEKQIREAFEKQAEQKEENTAVKSEDPEAFCEAEYKQIKLQKIYNKIAYDLTDPTLTVASLKERILDANNYTFESYMLLTSKIKSLKKGIKDLRKVCAVIGLGESTALAKKWEIRQAKALKVSEIQVIMPLSIIKEGKKRLIEKEFAEYKKIVGEKIAFTVAIDANNLTNDEFNMAINCALQAKPKKIYLKNAIKLPKSKLLFAVKACAEKCKVQVDFIISKSEEIKRHAERGIDIFVVEKAIALAESIKHEEE